MTIHVRIPSALRAKTDGVTEISVNVDSVARALQQLEEMYPALRAVLRDKDGTLCPRVNVYVNDVHVRYLQGMETPLNDGDQLYVMPIVMGG